jgi:hypothetical protein
MPAESDGSGGGATSTPPMSSQGQGRKHGSEGSGSGNSRRGATKRTFKKSWQGYRQAKFEGQCEDLKGHIYDCSDYRQADIFVRTTEEIITYVGRTYKYGDDVKRALTEMKIPTISYPEDPGSDASRTELKIWEKRMDECMKREAHLENNLKSAYHLIWGQCSDDMRMKLKGRNGYSNAEKSSNPIQLLNLIKTSVFQVQEKKYPEQSARDALRRLLNCTQDKHASAQEYLSSSRTW